MGTLIGHVAPGFGFFLIGFWHMYNHMKLFAINPQKYISFPWFPLNNYHNILRHFELYLIIISCSLSISMELIIGPARHTPFNPDGSIPSNHLHNFEHSSISLLFLIYAVFALLLDLLRLHARHHLDMLQLIAALSFAQQLLLFHLHSADHMGVEGQYHWLLQLVIAISLSTTLLGIPNFRSFIVSYLRSLSIMFQGVWLMFMGFMLWTPRFMMKGCFMHLEEGHRVVRCEGDESLHRAKALVNIAFSWFLIGLAVFAAGFYVVVMWVYGEERSTHDEQEIMYSEVGQVEDDIETAGGKNNQLMIRKKSGDDEMNTQQSYRNNEMARFTPTIDHMER